MKEALLEALKSENLLPDSDLTTDQVIQELTEAIEEYHKKLPREISDTRKELEALVSTLVKARNQLRDMSPQAIQIYCNVLGTSKGQLTSSILKVLIEAQEAWMVALNMKDREHDSELNVWAYHVARIMSDIMEIYPAATRDNAENITGTNGGAAYGRLLRKVATVGNIPFPKESYPIMRQALDILDDPQGNNMLTKD